MAAALTQPIMPALRCCPPHMSRLCWAAALYDWLRVTEDRVCVVLKKAHLEPLANAASKAAARGMADFVVVSYDLLKDVGKVLAALEFEVCGALRLLRAAAGTRCLLCCQISLLLAGRADEAALGGRCACQVVILDESHCIKNPKVAACHAAGPHAHDCMSCAPCSCAAPGSRSTPL